MSTDNQLNKVIEIAKNVKIAMLTTSDSANYLRSRPMATAKIEDNGNLWFFTDQFSDKVDEIQDNKPVNLAYSDPSNNTYLSITGAAFVVTDYSKMKELWSPVMKAWFPQGLESPRISLLQISPDSAEYWDASSSKLVQLYNMGKALFTGQKHSEVSNADHATVNL